MNGYVPESKPAANASGAAYGGKGGKAVPMSEPKNLRGKKYSSGDMR